MALLGTVAIAFLAARFLQFSPQHHTGHGWTYNVFRTIALADGLSHGNLARWVDFFHFGWGYPLFSFTPPLAYLPPAMLFLAGLTAIEAMNLVWFAGFLSAGISMLFCCRSVMSLTSAFFAATIYLLSPYLFVDCYVRANLGEFLAFTLVPPCLFSLIHVHSRRWLVIGCIGLMLLATTHMLSWMMTSCAIAVLSIFLLCIRRPAGPTIWRFLTVTLLGSSLGGWFLLPAINDLSFVSGLSRLTEEQYSVFKNFLSWKQLFAVYLPRKSETRSDIPLALGTIGVLCALLVSALSFGALWKRNFEQLKRVSPALALAATAAVFGLMSTSDSRFFWEQLPSLEVIQFPWRFHLITTSCLAISSGYLWSLLPQNRSTRAGYILCLCWAVAQHYGIPTSVNHWFLAESDLSREGIVEAGTTTTDRLEFLPGSVTAQYPSPPEAIVETVDPANQERIRKIERTNQRIRISIQPGEKISLIVNQHWFPAWRATADMQPIAVIPVHSTETTPFRLDLPKDASEVEVEFGLTTAGFLGRVLSALAFTALLVLTFFSPRLSKERTLYIAVLIGVLLFAYSPSLFAHFGFSDDYWFLVTKGAAEAIEPVMRDGRLLYALLLKIFFESAMGVESLSFLRFIGVLGLAAFAATLHWTLRSNNWGRGVSLLLPIFLVLTPAFGIYASWASIFHVPWALALALCAAAYAIRFARGKAAFISATISIVSLWAVLLLHQSALGGFLFGLTIAMLAPREPSGSQIRFRELLSAGTLGGFAVSTYLICYWNTIWPFSLEASKRGTTLSIDLVEQLQVFYRHPLLDSLSLFSVPQTPLLAHLLLAPLLLVFFLLFQRKLCSQWRILIAITLPVLAYAPQLVGDPVSLGFRTNASVQGFVLLYLARGLTLLPALWSRGATLFLFATLPFAIQSARTTTLHFMVRPQEIELAELKKSIAEEIIECPRRVELIPARPERSIAGEFRYDEYGFPSLASPWGIESMTRLVFLDHWSECRQPKFAVRRNVKSRSKKPSPTFVVNGNKLLSR